MVGYRLKAKPCRTCPLNTPVSRHPLCASAGQTCAVSTLMRPVPLCGCALPCSQDCSAEWLWSYSAPPQALEAAGITTKEGPLPPNKGLAIAPKPAVPKAAVDAGKGYTMEEVRVRVHGCSLA